MESAAKAAGPRAVGVLLTGMGQDGARGMVALRKAGAPTIGEAEETCVVYGMPKAAMRAGGVALERPLHEVAGTLLDLAIRNDLMEAS